MITCTFFAQLEALDYDLPERLLHVIESILRQDDEIEFLFYSKNRFLGLAWCAVQLLKRGYPQKHIHLTYVGDMRSEHHYLKRYFNGSVFPFEDEPNFIVQKKKRIRWCIVHADILITQLYEPMEGEEYRMLRYAQQQKGIRIINIMNRNTQEELWKQLDKLNPKDQDLIKWKQKGLPKQKIAEKYRIYPKHIGLHHKRAVYKLRSISRSKAKFRHPLDCYGIPWANPGL